MQVEHVLFIKLQRPGWCFTTGCERYHYSSILYYYVVVHVVAIALQCIVVVVIMITQPKYGLLAHFDSMLFVSLMVNDRNHRIFDFGTKPTWYEFQKINEKAMEVLTA